MTKSERRPLPTYTSSRVLFNGDWTEPERDLIDSAAAEAESKNAQKHRALPGKAWVCNVHEAGGRRYYMAHWNQRPAVVLSAHSAEELARKMRSLGNGE